MLPAMDGQHDDDFACKPKVDGVGKALQHRSAGLAVDSGKRQGTLDDPRDQGVDLLPELLPEARTPLVVPVAHFQQFVFGLRPEDDVSGHACRSSLDRT